jgi:hypothetical protein
MSAASKNEMTRLTLANTICTPHADLLDGSALRASYCFFFFCSFTHWCYSDNEPPANVNAVKSRRDYVLWRKGIHKSRCCEHRIKYDHLETEKRNERMTLRLSCKIGCEVRGS